MRNSNIRKRQSKSPSRTRAATSRSAQPKASTSKQAGNGAHSVYWGTVRHGKHCWGVDFEDFPGCISAGSTFEEVVLAGHESLGLHIRGMLADGDRIPAPSPRDVVAKRTAAEPGETIDIVAFVIRVTESSTPAVKVTITMQKGLVAAIDAWAADHNETRSAMLAAAARERMARA
jgi:predicted RNase H-like HicB family nuclease